MGLGEAIYSIEEERFRLVITDEKAGVLSEERLTPQVMHRALAMLFVYFGEYIEGRPLDLEHVSFVARNLYSEFHQSYGRVRMIEKMTDDEFNEDMHRHGL